MNTKNRISVGEFTIKAEYSPNFTVNLAEVIEHLRPVINSSPDEVKDSIEITFTPNPVERGYHYVAYRDVTATIFREMTVEEYAKANNAPSKAGKIQAIKNCFDSSSWTGRK